ncbi:MAG: autotransporter outer membrane beta-barrel domain-containing protein, partial [Rhodocyclaceae bacterium]|nr:autotransporter outer membrane beta-barrel domain-containing protein [Rhodocyclaceae bacterium]
YLASAYGVNAAPISISDTSPLVTWSLLQNGNDLSARYQGLNASPAGYAFNKSQQNFLNYVINGYNAGDAGVGYALGSLVSNGAAANLYGALNSLNGAAQTIQSQTIVMTGNAMLGNALSCPTFEQNGTIYGETECVWGKYNGGQLRQAYSDNNTGYRANDNTFSVGGQFRIASDTFVGASGRFGQTSTSSGNFGATANVGDVSVSIKKIVGDYYLGVAGAFGVASQSNNRYTTDFFTGQGYNMTSHSNAYYGGVRARNAYQFNLPRNTYIKPYLDLDGLWIHTPSYQENGSAQGVPLQFNTQNSFNFMASPMVEVGGRIDLESKNDAWIRPFVSAGAMFITNNTTNIAASIVGANSGTYQMSAQAPSALFNANAGIQVFSGEKVDVKLEYSAQAGQGFVGQTGSAKVNYRF